MANTQDIKPKHLEAKGEMDYDYINDILFFKVKDREYDISLEFQNMVVDIDKEKFITGIQIFDASAFLKIDKTNLRKISKWKFQAQLANNELRIELYYQIIIRNQTINNNLYPIVVQQNTLGAHSPQVVATT